MKPHSRHRKGHVTTTTDIAVVVLAAGAGTRMRSATPKVLHPLGGRSMITHALLAVTALEPSHALAEVIRRAGACPIAASIGWSLWRIMH